MTDDICGHEKNDGEECTFSPKYEDGKCGHHTEHTEDGDNKKSLLEQNDSIVQLIAGEVQNGSTISEACSEANISRSTHDNWMSRGKKDDGKEIYKEYRSEVTRARNLAARNDRRELITECRESGDTRTWWKVHQQQYGDLYAEDAVEDDARPVFNVPEDIVEEWQPVKQ